MAAWLLLVVAAVCVGMTQVPGTGACSCARAHIQEHFCAGDFVIRVRVKSEALPIYEVLGNGKVYPVSRKYEIGIKNIWKGKDILDAIGSSEDTSEDGTSEESSESVDVTSSSEAFDNDDTELVVAERLLSNVTSAEDNTTEDTLSATEGYSFTGTEEYPLNATELPPVNATELPPVNATELPPVNATERPPVETTEGVPSVASKMWLYTGYHDSMCGIYLQPHRSYLVIGWIHGGRLWTGLCMHTQLWTQVNPRQRRNLGMHLYDNNCGVCQICRTPGCDNDTEQRNACRWSAYDDRGNCYEENSFCEHRGGRCAWREGPHLRKCLKKVNDARWREP